MFSNGDEWNMIFREIGDAIGFIFGAVPVARQTECPDCHAIFSVSVPLKSEIKCPQCGYPFVVH